MSYDYAARVVFVGRLATTRHPALYDLCADHERQPQLGAPVRREAIAQREGRLPVIADAGAERARQDAHERDAELHGRQRRRRRQV